MLGSPDPELLEQVARDERSRVFRQLGKMLGPRPDLEDHVQNVFVEMCRAAKAFRGESRFTTFLGGIAVRVAWRATRHSARLGVHQELSADLASLAPAPDELAERRESLRHARDLLARLGRNKRVAFLMWAVDGKSPAEIAASMGASVSATRSRIYYAQLELRSRALKDPSLRDFVPSSVGCAGDDDGNQA